MVPHKGRGKLFSHTKDVDLQGSSLFSFFFLFFFLSTYFSCLFSLLLFFFWEFLCTTCAGTVNPFTSASVTKWIVSYTSVVLLPWQTHTGAVSDWSLRQSVELDVELHNRCNAYKPSVLCGWYPFFFFFHLWLVVEAAETSLFLFRSSVHMASPQYRHRWWEMCRDVRTRGADKQTCLIMLDWLCSGSASKLFMLGWPQRCEEECSDPKQTVCLLCVPRLDFEKGPSFHDVCTWCGGKWWKGDNETEVCSARDDFKMTRGFRF